MINLNFKKYIFVHFLTIIFIVLSTPGFSKQIITKEPFDPASRSLLSFRCEDESLLRSLPELKKSAKSHNMRIKNNTSGIVNYFWLDRKGVRKKYFEIRPLTTAYVTTYVGHLWVATDDKNRWIEIVRPWGSLMSKAIHVLSTPNRTSASSSLSSKTRTNYADRCNLSLDDVKEVQRSLKKIGLYTSSIDGIAGKGTETGIALAKAKLGMNASPGECFNQSDVKAGRAMMPDLLCDFDVDQCSDKMLCEKGTYKRNPLTSFTVRKWKIHSSGIKFADKAKAKGLSCDVEKICSLGTLDTCTDIELCTKATNVSNGLRSWKEFESLFVKRAKGLGLECGITVDSSPLTQQEAIYFLSQLTDFVADNSSNFDLDFASEFNKVRPITQGNWSSNLSEVFENFRAYSLKLESFQQYIEDVRLAEETRDKKRIEELRASISQDIIILKNWGKANVLDEKAAQISVLVTEFGNKDLQTINELEQTAKQSQNLLVATGIKDGPAMAQTQDIVDSLYNPSSIYVFANVTGDAENLYKNLDGNFDFEQTTGTHCSSDKFTAFDQYMFTKKFFEKFNDLSTLNGNCRPSSDIFVAKGNELTSDRLFNQVNLSGLELIFEMSKDQRDAEFDQLAFLKTAIKNDVMDGIRVGFGLLRADTSSQKSCGIIKDQEQGHIAQLNNNRMLLIALGYERDTWENFDKTTQSDEEAFKMLQRGQCGFIYGSELTLARLYLASERAKIKLEFMPIWISPTALEISQRLYDAEKTAETEANSKVEKTLKEQAVLDAKKAELEKQKLEDQLVLEQQALKSTGEVAAVRQREMRERNGLKFSVLKDKFQDLLFIAVQFGLENSVEEMGYESKYLEQPFVDPILSNSVFDGVITDMQILAAERWEVTEQKLNQIDFGEAIFKGRALDALVVELQISSKNRLIGQYQEYCRRVHIIFDDDFEMWRSPEIGECDQSITNTDWYNSWQFQSKWIAQP